MTTPQDYPYARVRELWGGVRGNIQNNVTGADTTALASAQSAAESGERRRRALGSMTPGHGAQMNLPRPYADAGQGSPPTAGEGYAVEAPAAPAQVYVPHGTPVYGARPHYAACEVGGLGYPDAIAEPSLRFTVSPGLGVVVSPQAAAKPGLLSRLMSRLRGRR